MRIFLSVLILIFSLQSLSWADDIRDFEIEGMSIGDSALDFFLVNDIKNSITYEYLNSDKFYSFDIIDDSGRLYNAFQIHVKSNDNQYILHGVTGAITFENDAIKANEECHNKIKIIEKDIDNAFDNEKKVSRIFDAIGQAADDNFKLDPNSIRHEIMYKIENGHIWLQCTIWSKEFLERNNYFQNLKITILEDEFFDWMMNKAY
jgi:hypothetical protein